MVTAVIVINILISLFCFYLVRRLCKIRRQVARAANAVLAAERHTHRVLHRAPQAIIKGQHGTGNLREKYQHLQQQLNQVQTIITLLNWGQKRLRRNARPVRRLQT